MSDTIMQNLETAAHAVAKARSGLQQEQLRPQPNVALHLQAAERTALEAIQKALTLALQPGPVPKPGEVAEAARCPNDVEGETGATCAICGGDHRKKADAPSMHRGPCDDCQGELRLAQNRLTGMTGHRDSLLRQLHAADDQMVETVAELSEARAKLAKEEAEHAETCDMFNTQSAKLADALADMRERCARAAQTAESPIEVYRKHDGRVTTLDGSDTAIQRRLCAAACRALPLTTEEAKNA